MTTASSRVLRRLPAKGPQRRHLPIASPARFAIARHTAINAGKKQHGAMWLLAGLIWIAVCANAQSIRITAPTQNSTISGFSYQFACSVSAIGNLAYVQYSVDGEAVGYAKALDPQTCPSLNWNTYNVGNGSGHVVDATAYSSAGVVVATATEITGIHVENWLPQQTCVFSATPSNACTDIDVSVAPAASMNLATAGAGPDIVSAAITLKPSGASAPTIVGTPSVTGNNGTSVYSLASPGRSITSTSNYVIAFVHWYSPNGASISTLTDSDGNNFLAGTCTTVSTVSIISSEACMIRATAAHLSGYTVTATWSGQAGLNIHVLEISGAAASSPQDVLLNDGFSMGGQAKSQIVSSALPMQAANELILWCVGWDNFNGAASAGAGFTLEQSPGTTTLSSACEWMAEKSAWVGQEAFTVTVNGSNATVTKDFQMFVDGLSIGGSGVTPAVTSYQAAGGYLSSASSTSTSLKLWIDTSRFYNSATHRVAIVVNNTNATNCSICILGTWSTIGTWERQVSFSNPSTALVELTTNARDQKIVCPGAIPGSCTTPVGTLSGNLHFADGSASSASVTCASSNTAVATVSGCAITPVALGSASITVTDTSGLTRNAWVYVVAANNYPNVGNDGTIQTGYVPGNTSLIRSGFQTGGHLADYAHQGWARAGYTASQFVQDWANGGYNAVEIGIGNPPGVSGAPSTESAYDSYVQANVNYFCASLTNGVTPYFVADSFIGSNGVYYGTRAYNLSFTTPAFQYIYSQWRTLCSAHPTRGNTIADEISSIYSWGTIPCGTLDTGCTLGSGDITQVVCTSGANCAATCPAGCKVLQNQFFIITGSGTALDYPTTGTGTGAAVPVGTLSAGNTVLTWPNPGVGTITYTATSNNCGAGGTSSCANLKIEPNIPNATHNAAFNPCNGIGGAAPCTDWVRSNAFINYYKWAHAGNPKAIITYAPSGAANSPLGESLWCGSQTDTCDYYSSGVDNYLPTRGSISSFISDSPSQMGGGWRNDYGVFAKAPTTAETQGVTANYAYTGYPVALASCSGDICTTANPHGLANVINGFSRLWIAGSTGNADGTYMIRATPDGTHIQILQATPTTTGGGIGTITFDDSNSYTVLLGDSDFLIQSCPNNALLAERGHNFTTALKAGTWYYDIASGGVCGVYTGSYNFVWQVPNLSSTGGTAYIIPDNYMIRGRNWEGNGESGPRPMFASINYCVILGCDGSRQYLIGAGNSSDPMGFDPTQAVQAYAFSTDGQRRVFGGRTQINIQNVQAGLHPRWDLTRQSRWGFACSALANLLTQRLVKYEFQPWLPSPDLGRWYEGGVRQDSNGNTILMIQQFADAPTSLTVDLRPYKIAGQPIIKYVANCEDGIQVSTLASSATTDTTSSKDGWFVAYVFDQNPGAQLSQPTVSAQLSDVPNATRIQIRFAYTPYAFEQQQDMIPEVFECGTGVCSLPVDLQIGHVYYKITYLNSSGAVVADSDVQQL